MGTHAGIGMLMPDGTVKAVYLHWDGYPGSAGGILGGWYNTTARITELIELGDLSSLGTKIAPDPSMPHTIDKPQEDVVSAFCRDCYEEPQPALTFASKTDYEQRGKGEFDADYLYLFEDGKWFVLGIYQTPEWVEWRVIRNQEQ